MSRFIATGTYLAVVVLLVQTVDGRAALAAIAAFGIALAALT